MASKEFRAADAIPERSTYLYEVTLKDKDGVPIPSGSVNTIALWLRDVTSDGIVNSRNNVPVKNANGGTLTTGLFTFQFAAEDMVMVGSASLEKRILTLDFGLTGGRMTRDVSFYVRSLRDITT